MTDEEVNRVISEFDKFCLKSKCLFGGACRCGSFKMLNYTEHPGVLVTVWEKLKSIYGYDVLLCTVGDLISDFDCEYEDAIQQVTARITAKVILELKDER